MFILLVDNVRKGVLDNVHEGRALPGFEPETSRVVEQHPDHCVDYRDRPEYCCQSGGLLLSNVFVYT